MTPTSSDERDRAGDIITLSLPAETPYARIARIGAASLAFRWGFGQRQVADLRLAVDEAVILLLGDGDHPGQISIEYRLLSDGMEIEAAAEFGDGDDPLLADEIDRFVTLVGELVSEYELMAETGRVRMVFEKV